MQVLKPIANEGGRLAPTTFVKMPPEGITAEKEENLFGFQACISTSVQPVARAVPCAILVDFSANLRSFDKPLCFQLLMVVMLTFRLSAACS